MHTTSVSSNGSAFSTLLCSDEIRKHIDDSSVPFGLCCGLIPLAVLSLASSLSWLLLAVPSTHTSSCCITAKGRDSGSLCLSPLLAPFGSELYDLTWLLQLRGSVADLWSRGALWFACCRGKVHSREGPNAYDDMHMHMYVRAQITNMMTTITTNHSPNHKWKTESTKGGRRNSWNFSSLKRLCYHSRCRCRRRRRRSLHSSRLYRCRALFLRLLLVSLLSLLLFLSLLQLWWQSSDLPESFFFLAKIIAATPLRMA